MGDNLLKVEYPPILPVFGGQVRPFWSVMIPVYNPGDYLGATLRSIISQDPGTDAMQIEIVDDCSTECGYEKLIQEIVPPGRVNIFRQPKNVGLANNWNTCINRARGHVVHILHQDDEILSGYYSRLEIAFRDNSVGAAFCRHMCIDENDHPLFYSPLERETPGILDDWLEHIVIAQTIQTPAIVVRRNIYEQLGGFSPKLIYALDWEMWIRIAAHSQYWYEPQVLACYRIHGASETNRLALSGGDIADTFKVINLSTSHLGKRSSRALYYKARVNLGAFYLDKAIRLFSSNHFSAAIIHFKLILRSIPLWYLPSLMIKVYQLKVETRWIGPAFDYKRSGDITATRKFLIMGILLNPLILLNLGVLSLLLETTLGNSLLSKLRDLKTLLFVRKGSA